MEIDASNVDELSLLDNLSHVSKIDTSIVDELSPTEIDAPNVDKICQLNDLIHTSYPQINFDGTMPTISSFPNDIDEYEFLNDIDDHLSPYP